MSISVNFVLFYVPKIIYLLCMDLFEDFEGFIDPLTHVWYKI